MPGEHERNTKPMLHSPRCGAKTRAGRHCNSPATRGRRRCRMHGGAAGSGAPYGNQNAFKTGLHTAELRMLRRQMRALAQACKRTLADIVA